MKRTQQGLSLTGFLVTLTLVIFFAYCGMKIGPMYMEFYSVKEALKGLSNDPEMASAPKEKIRMMFDRRLDMSYAEKARKLNILKIDTIAEGYNLVVDYERREPMFFNLDVVARFHAEQVLARGAHAD